MGFQPVGDDVVPRYFHRASLLNDGRVMVTGGMGLSVLPPSLYSLDAISFFDPDAQTFRAEDTRTGKSPKLHLGRCKHTQTTLIDGRVLITGGMIGAHQSNLGEPTETVEVFDPSTGTMAMGPPMAARRGDHSATRLSDGRVVVAGPENWQFYTPRDDAWSPAIPLVAWREAHSAILIPAAAGKQTGEQILLIGGFHQAGNSLELLDPSSGRTRTMNARLPQPTGDMGAVRLADGRIFIVGGKHTYTGQTIPQAFFYDLRMDRLTAAPQPLGLPRGIEDHHLAIIGPFVCLFGGEVEVGGKDQEQDYAAIFDTRNKTWADPMRMLRTHDDFAAVPMNPGQILLVGGGVAMLGQEAPSSNAEVFVLSGVSPD